MNNVFGYVAILLASLLAALVIALIFRRDFRDALLGAPGEATVLGFLTVKGVAIVLLCGLLIGGILFVLTHLPAPTPPPLVAQSKPVTVLLNVNFDPNDVNPQNPKVHADAFIKTPEGVKRIPSVPLVQQGSVAVRVTVPDMNTPFFVVFDTPKGIWQTDDFSATQAHAIAHKIGQE